MKSKKKPGAPKKPEETKGRLRKPKETKGNPRPKETQARESEGNQGKPKET